MDVCLDTCPQRLLYGGVFWFSFREQLTFGSDCRCFGNSLPSWSRILTWQTGDRRKKRRNKVLVHSQIRAMHLQLPGRSSHDFSCPQKAMAELSCTAQWGKRVTEAWCAVDAQWLPPQPPRALRKVKHMSLWVYPCICFHGNVSWEIGDAHPLLQQQAFMHLCKCIGTRWGSHSNHSPLNPYS